MNHLRDHQTQAQKFVPHENLDGHVLIRLVDQLNPKFFFLDHDSCVLKKIKFNFWHQSGIQKSVAKKTTSFHDPLDELCTIRPFYEWFFQKPN